MPDAGPPNSDDYVMSLTEDKGDLRVAQKCLDVFLLGCVTPLSSCGSDLAHIYLSF